MIKNKVFKLLQKTTLKNGVVLPEGQELEVVMDVVYMGGYLIPPNMQSLVLNWIKDNPNLLTDVTRKW